MPQLPVVPVLPGATPPAALTLWKSWKPVSGCSAVWLFQCGAGLWPPPHSHCWESMPTAPQPFSCGGGGHEGFPLISLEVSEVPGGLKSGQIL